MIYLLTNLSLITAHITQICTFSSFYDRYESNNEPEIPIVRLVQRRHDRFHMRWFHLRNFFPLSCPMRRARWGSTAAAAV